MYSELPSPLLLSGFILKQVVKASFSAWSWKRIWLSDTLCCLGFQAREKPQGENYTEKLVCLASYFLSSVFKASVPFFLLFYFLDNKYLAHTAPLLSHCVYLAFRWGGAGWWGRCLQVAVSWWQLEDGPSCEGGRLQTTPQACGEGAACRLHATPWLSSSFWGRLGEDWYGSVQTAELSTVAQSGCVVSKTKGSYLSS